MVLETDILGIIQNVGFPIAITIFILVRMEGTQRKNSEAVSNSIVNNTEALNNMNLSITRFVDSMNKNDEELRDLRKSIEECPKRV
jgi:hypothetical protein